jgi:hypothetical protein
MLCLQFPPEDIGVSKNMPGKLVKTINNSLCVIRQTKKIEDTLGPQFHCDEPEGRHHHQPVLHVVTSSYMKNLVYVAHALEALGGQWL